MTFVRSESVGLRGYRIMAFWVWVCAWLVYEYNIPEA